MITTTAPFVLACQVLFFTTAIATAALREERPTLDLSGEWEFRIDPTDAGRNEKWFAPGTPFPELLRVPGAWNAQGVGFPSPGQLRAYEDAVL